MKGIFRALLKNLIFDDYLKITPQLLKISIACCVPYISIASTRDTASDDRQIPADALLLFPNGSERSIKAESGRVAFNFTSELHATNKALRVYLNVTVTQS